MSMYLDKIGSCIEEFPWRERVRVGHCLSISMLTFKHSFLF